MSYIDFTTNIQRVADGVWIPKDENNRDYQEYLKWVEAGNQPLQP